MARAGMARWRIQRTGLDALHNSPLSFTGDVMIKLAEEVIEDIKANWSPISVSDPGEAPAKLTGYLEDSLSIVEMRDSMGRFTSGDKVVQCSVRARAEYAAALEYGYAPRNLLPRPFLAPAVERVVTGERSQKLFVDAIEQRGEMKYRAGAKGRWLDNRGDE